LLLGDAAGADAALAACVRLAAEQPYRYVVFQARFFEAARAACRGDLVATERLLAEARALGRDRTAYAELQCDAHLLWTKMQRGEREQLVPLSATLLPRIAATWRGAERVASAAMALLAVGAGEGDEARRLLAEVEGAGFATLERDEHFLLAAASTTDVVYRLGDTRRAASLYAVVSPYAHLFGCHDLLRTFSGSVSAVLGELCLALGRVDEAIARYESALAIEAKAGARASQVSSQVMLARALRTRAARGDARRATDLLRQVAATAPSLGIDWSARFGFDPETLAEHPSAPL
jgi:tetratricopeptide (TPR) repeat protein